ncbi:DUF7147 family protein [Metabacillus sp. 84]|uniref:DUF7147 family protein n=1 Tax=unclassified Metabacillus TaxID=2675274 RepID=UPI003CE9947A
MIQRFIELGEGYSDLYELLEIIKHQEERIISFILLHTEWKGKKSVSAGVIMSPADPGDFLPIYFCREGIADPREKETKRHQLFREAAEKTGKPINQFDVKPSALFHENVLYYQYLTGILRLNHILPPLK